MKNIKFMLIILFLTSCGNTFESTYLLEYTNGDKEEITCVSCILNQNPETDCVYLKGKKYCGVRKWKKVKYIKLNTDY